MFHTLFIQLQIAVSKHLLIAILIYNYIVENIQSCFP